MGPWIVIPLKAPKKKPVPVYLTAFIIKDSQGRYLLEKNEREGLYQASGISFEAARKRPFR